MKTRLDAAYDPGKALESGFENPKTKLSSHYLPQGCSAKRGIILDEWRSVYNFFLLVRFLPGCKCR